MLLKNALKHAVVVTIKHFGEKVRIHFFLFFFEFDLNELF